MIRDDLESPMLATSEREGHRLCTCLSRDFRCAGLLAVYRVEEAAGDWW